MNEIEGIRVVLKDEIIWKEFWGFLILKLVERIMNKYDK